jgi:hypothetical protein
MANNVNAIYGANEKGKTMDIHTAMEELYKNGYLKGYEDGSREHSRRGHWIIRSSGSGEFVNNWAECSFCHVCGSPHWKLCPVCEAKMEV